MAELPKLELIAGVGTDVGKERPANQDRAAFTAPVAVLADGMGGHKAGETAAQMAVDEIKAKTGHLTGSDLALAFKEANANVNRSAQEPEYEKMGTTLVAVSLQLDGEIAIANVGDSRAYLLRDGYLAQITQDHSFVEDLVRQGRITHEEAAVHPNRNILTRALGVSPEVEVDTFIVEPKPQDRFLLCSDGLFNEVSEAEFTQILVDNPDPVDAANKLIEAALQTPCRDNVTVIVVDAILAGSAGSANGSDIATNASALTAPLPAASGANETQELPALDGDVTVDSAELQGLNLEAAAEPDLPDPTAELNIVAGDADTSSILAAETEMPSNGDGSERPAANSKRRPKPKRDGMFGDLSWLIPSLWIFAFAAVAAVGYAGASRYAKATYFVEETEAGLAIFNGRPGGFLWVEPDLVSQTPTKASELTEAAQKTLGEANTFPDLEAAEDHVKKLREESPPASQTGPDSETSPISRTVTPPSEVKDLDASLIDTTTP